MPIPARRSGPGCILIGVISAAVLCGLGIFAIVCVNAAGKTQPTDAMTLNPGTLTAPGDSVTVGDASFTKPAGCSDLEHVPDLFGDEVDSTVGLSCFGKLDVYVGTFEGDTAEVGRLLTSAGFEGTSFKMAPTSPADDVTPVNGLTAHRVGVTARLNGAQKQGRVVTVVGNDEVVWVMGLWPVGTAGDPNEVDAIANTVRIVAPGDDD